MERARLISLLRAAAPCEEHHGCVFLCDPHWGDAERGQFRDLLQTGAPDLPTERGWLCIPTGGTGGKLRFARHDEFTLTAAVDGFCRHFKINHPSTSSGKFEVGACLQAIYPPDQVSPGHRLQAGSYTKSDQPQQRTHCEMEKVNAVGVLPLHHVSGLMAWARCAFTGGKYLGWDWKALEAGKFPVTDHGAWFLSLVPTQLQRLMAMPAAVDWLRGFRAVFVGGGPAWPELLAAAAAARVPVSLCYGMTETAAMIAAQRPVEFLAGDRSSGRVMPHAKVRTDAEGIVCVSGGSVCRGFWPELVEPAEFATDDLGEIDAEGRLWIHGRRDDVIITGGKKVHPAEVEAVLRGSGEFADVAVLGLPDAEWGQRVVAAYVAAERPPDLERAVRSLAGYQRPKRFFAVSAGQWPRNAQGKLDRARLLSLSLR